MINEILQQVQQEKGPEFAQKTGIEENKIPPALETISSTVMKEAKKYIDEGSILELKDLFIGGDEAEKQAFMNNMKSLVTDQLSTNLSIKPNSAEQLTELSVPEIIRVAKEKLLGPDGKVGLADFPRLLSFFKSEGKEVKDGGLGSLFGF